MTSKKRAVSCDVQCSTSLNSFFEARSKCLSHLSHKLDGLYGTEWLILC